MGSGHCTQIGAPCGDHAVDVIGLADGAHGNRGNARLLAHAIGKWGLFCITVIVLIGVGASLKLDESKIAAVIGLVSAALTALIAMLNGIAGASPKQEKPEFEVIKSLIEKLDRDEHPMTVDVKDNQVVVTKGHHTINAERKNG